MTNGEKFQQIFAVSQVDECDLNVYAWLPIHDAIEIPLEWWNANYSEIPTGSTDCISRQAVIDLMMQKWGENFSGDDAMQESIDAIREMPSVTPQEPRWIPVSERLPNWNTECLVIDGDGECGVGYYREDAHAWDSPNWGWLERKDRVDNKEAFTEPCGIGKVIAWMPLKPYEPQEVRDKE